MEEARRRLAAGRPVGIFPEGTVNRNRTHLLRGRLGAARLSLETGVPIVPAGLRYPSAPADGLIPEGSPVEIEFGPAMQPPVGADAMDWHVEIMAAIGTLSHKIPTSGRGDDA
jgi:1-acyl-sn-glycerol-3-phosphate acyltransferase